MEESTGNLWIPLRNRVMRKTTPFHDAIMDPFWKGSFIIHTGFWEEPYNNALRDTLEVRESD